MFTRRRRIQYNIMDGSQSRETSELHQLKEPQNTQVCWGKSVLGDGNSKDALAEAKLAKLLAASETFIWSTWFSNVESYRSWIKVLFLSIWNVAYHVNPHRILDLYVLWFANGTITLILQDNLNGLKISSTKLA